MLDNYGSEQKTTKALPFFCGPIGRQVSSDKRDLPIENYCRKDPVVGLGTE